MTNEEFDRGIEAVERWVKLHPNKEAYIVLSGSDEDCWSPKLILEALRQRRNTPELDQCNDIPVIVLKSFIEVQDNSLSEQPT